MEEKTEEFTKMLDEVSLKKWEEIYDVLKNIKDINSISFTVFPTKEKLSEFNLTEDFNFMIENKNGSGKMKYFYKSYPVQPESYYLLPENYREVPLLEMLLECVKQDTHKPDIKHLQVQEKK